MDYVKLLKPLGLSEKEAQVYLALLKLGEGSVMEIAKEAGLKRPTVYVILEELRMKEAILKAPQSKRTIYIAKSPSEIYRNHSGQIEDLFHALPTLNAMHKKDDRANILYFEGVKGVEESLYYRQSELKNTKIFGFWAKVDKWDAKTKKVIDTWSKSLVNDGITIQAIAPNHPSLKEYRKTDNERNREVKVVPVNNYSSNTSIEITEFFVRITQYDTPQAIIIESPEFVKTFKEIFNMAWNSR